MSLLDDTVGEHGEPDDIGDADAATPGVAGGPTGRRPWGAPGTWAAFWFPFAVFATISLIAQRVLFQTSYDAWGDSAVNGLSVLRAEHFQQLVGNYSRVGFHHPGPALMYLLAAGEGVFFHLLGVAPAPYNGQLLGVSVYVSAFLASITLIVYRATRSWGATALVAGVVFFFAARMPLFGQDWFPYLYVSAFLLMMVAGAAVAAGATRELPFFVLAGGLLAHGHASFLMFVGVTTAAVFASWCWLHRRRVRAELVRHRWAAWITLGVIALLCLPALVDLVLHFPGQWGRYLEFTAHAQREPRTVSDVLGFVGAGWTSTGIPWGVYVVAGIVGAFLLLTERDRVRRRAALMGHAMVALQTLLFLYYVARGVDFITPVELYEYVGYFYRSAPVVLFIVVLCHGWLRLGDLLAEGPAGLLTPAALVLAVAAVVGATAGSDLERTVPAGRTFAEAADAIADLDTAQRPVVLRHVVGDVWATGAGVGLALERRGLDWCITGPNAAPIMFQDDVCTRSERATGLVVRLTDEPVPSGAEVIWRDEPTDPRLRPLPIVAFVKVR